jgi:YVTN family beta-propeller protein
MKRTQGMLVFLVLSLLAALFLSASNMALAGPGDPPANTPLRQEQSTLSAPSGLSRTPGQLNGAAVIAVFDDPNYVDTEGYTSSESDNVQAGLAAMGYIVQPFTGIDEASWSAALAGANILAIPELENNSYLGNDLSPAARSVIADFVSQGGGLIQFYYGSDFLNPVLGLSLDHSGGDSSSITAAAEGTAFHGGPASLPSNNATWGLDRTTFPAGGLAIYSSGGNSAEVAWMPYGGGQIVYLGWDWYDAAPPGSQDGGWLEVLNRAVMQVGNPFLGLVPASAKGYDTPGSIVIYELALVNGTTLTDTYTLELSGNLWPTALPYAITPPLSDGDYLEIAVQVAIPAGAAAGTYDDVTLTATSVTSPTAFSATASIRTIALCPGYLTIAGRSSETYGDLDDLWEYGGQTFAVARLTLYSEDADSMDADLRGYDLATGWQTIASGRDVGNGVFFDDVLLPARYTALNVLLDDTDDNDLIYYDYEFLVCRHPAVDVKPDAAQLQYAESGQTAIYTYTLTNFLMAPGQFDLITSGPVWPTSVRTTSGAPLSRTPLLADLEVYTFTVQVNVPAGAVPGAADDGLVTASGVGQPAIRDDGEFQTTVSSGQYGYVFTQQDNQIHVLDTAIHAVVGAIDTTLYGDGPYLGGLSPDGSRLYVSLRDSGRVLIVDTATQQPLAAIDVGQGPRNAAFTADGTYAFIPNRWSGSLSVINTGIPTPTVTVTLTMGDSPMIVVTSACLGKAYVTNLGSDTVSVIDTATLSVVDTITGFSRPWGIVLSPFGRRAYVVNQGGGSIGVIDTAIDELVATWQLPGWWLQMIDISPDGRTLYVVDNERGAVLVVDAFSGDLLTVIPSERSEAWYIEAFPAGAGNYAYFSRPYPQQVAVVNTETQRVERLISLAGVGDARGLALFPMDLACLAGDVALSPTAPHLVAPAGESVNFGLYVTNLSIVTDTFALSPSGGTWPAHLSAPTTGPLAPGETFPLTVTVDIPTGAAQGVLDAVTLTASGAGGSDAAMLTSSVLRPGFVFDEDERVIHVVDTFYHLDSGIDIDTSSYGGKPFRGTLSPDVKLLYVGLRDSDSLLIVDAVELAPVAMLEVGSGPQDVAFNLDGSRAFVTNRWDGTISVIDTGIPEVIDEIEVAGQVMGLTRTCADRLYVAVRGPDGVAVVDTAGLTVTQVITGLSRPWGVVADPLSRRVYVSNQTDRSVSVIDTRTDSLIAAWPVPGADWLADLDVSPSGRWLYVADADMGDIYVLDTRTGALQATMTATGDGRTAWEVEALPGIAGPWVYATFPYDGWLGVFNTADHTMEKVLLLGDGELRGMALFPPTWFYHRVQLPLVLKSGR